MVRQPFYISWIGYLENMAFKVTEAGKKQTGIFLDDLHLFCPYQFVPEPNHKTQPNWKWGWEK